jgi:tetratricopeptide (TPR) repeat protein
MRIPQHVRPRVQRTGAWLAGLEAEANAILGRTTDSLRALDRAQAAWSNPRGDPAARPRATFFDGARLAGEQGICLSRLGRPAEAQLVLRSALATLSPDQQKSRARLLAALGTTHAQTGDIEEACRIGTEALDSPVGMAVQPNLHDVLRLRQFLDPWHDTAVVRDLDDRLAAIV